MAGRCRTRSHKWRVDVECRFQLGAALQFLNGFTLNALRAHRSAFVTPRDVSRSRHANSDA